MHLQGTASTLTRAEVRGGGKKPYSQKGSGNARQGSIRTPLKPGGGVVFGPKVGNLSRHVKCCCQALASKHLPAHRMAWAAAVQVKDATLTIATLARLNKTCNGIAVACGQPDCYVLV